MKMTKMRTLFYKAKWFDGHLLDNVIYDYTRTANIWLNPAHMKEGFFKRRKIIDALACSHCEVWWPDKNGNFKYGIFKFSSGYLSECFTSTMGVAGGKNRTGDGTIIRPASEVLKHPKRWIYCEKEVPKEALEHTKKWAIMMVYFNLGYDRGDIWKLLNLNENKRWQDIDDYKLICSGACWAFDSVVAEYWLSILNKLDVYSFMDTTFGRLTRVRTIDMLPSPLLLALWNWMAGAKFYDLATGKEII